MGTRFTSIATIGPFAPSYNSGCCSHHDVHGVGYEPNARNYEVVRINYSGGVRRRADCPLRPWNVEVYSPRRGT
ncbi:hypothetical protein NL676_039155 [Syzygium grande]|nr:hypothetical protein NL676_039155 [Syzygium grande]